MDRELWLQGTYYYQMTEVYGEVEQALAQNTSELDREYIEKVRENPNYAQEKEYPRTHLQHAIAMLQWSLEDQKNKWRKWKIKRDMEVLMDYFYDNKRRTAKEKLIKYWKKFVYKWQKEKR